MKWWMPGAFCVVICSSMSALAEELQFRPIGSAPTPPVVRTNFETQTPPAPLVEGGSETPVFRPVSLARPTPLVRGQKADQDVVRPLPAGPSLLFVGDKNDGGKPADPKKVESKSPIEIIPVTPRTLNSPPATSFLDDPCACTEIGPTYVGGQRLVMGECCDMSCDPCAIDCGTCCMSRPSHWFRAEYLGWRVKNDRIPVLVTAGDVNNQAVLGASGTRILLDNNNFNDDKFQSGGRFTFGFWLQRFDCLGFEASYMFLSQRKQSFQFGNGNGDVIGRPFTEVNPFVQDPPGSNNFVPTPFDRVEFVRFPGALEGTVRVDSYTRLWGAEANLRSKLWCNECSHVDLIYGYRYFQLSEGITITENLTTLPSPGTQINVTDRFNTRNTFNGGQVGLDGEYRFLPRWTVSGFAKVALGNVNQQVRINGSTYFGDTNQTLPGGLLASTTNIGSYSQNRFAVMPEAGLRLNYDLTDHLRLYVGYNFTYLSSVVRPGQQIDTVVNSGFAPRADPMAVGVGQGPARPSVLFKTSDFWAQGVNFGIEYHW